MPTQVDQREIEVSPTGSVASAVADAINEMQDSGSLIQHLSGDIEDMSAEVAVNAPYKVLEAARGALVAADPHEHPDVPTAPDRFGVVAVDITVDERPTVTIEVYD